MVSTQVERNCLFQQALEDWRKLLGSRRIKSALNECSDFEKATFKTHSKILAIIAIETREELQAVIKIANFHQITVYPISGGKNWGLGSRVPTQTGSVVLDLRGMNQITQFNEEMATIRVQAGVSFQQVFDFLDSKNADLMIDPTGGISGGQCYWQYS